MTNGEWRRAEGGGEAHTTAMKRAARWGGSRGGEGVNFDGVGLAFDFVDAHGIEARGGVG